MKRAAFSGFPCAIGVPAILKSMLSYLTTPVNQRLDPLLGRRALMPFRFRRRSLLAVLGGAIVDCDQALSIFPAVHPRGAILLAHFVGKTDSGKCLMFPQMFP